VQKGSDVLYGGFTVGGSTRKRVLIRALGPSLKSAGIKKTLDNPSLELRGAAGAITSNDNWRDTNRDALAASKLAPTSDREAAIILTLEPGNYTAIVRGPKNATGTAVLEVYDLGLE
jgi:hypothetical protein